MPVVNCCHQDNTVNALATLLTSGIQIYNLFERGLYNACCMFQPDVSAATKPATRPLRPAGSFLPAAETPFFSTERL